MQRGLAWLAALMAVVAMSLASALELSHGGAHDMSPLELALTCVAVLVSAVLGVRVVSTKPGQRMGWVLLGMAVVGAALTLGEVYAFDALVRHGHVIWGARTADVATEGSWVVAYAALSVVALLFPTGRLSDRGWRPLGALACVAFPAAAVVVTLQPGPQDHPFDHVRNPAGVRWIGTAPGQALTATVMLLALGCMAGCVAALLDRFVRGTNIERQQIKALLYAAALTPLALLVCLALRSDQLASVLLPLALATVPLAVGLAVLRYRLYDVDRLVNRTAVYVVLTTLLALVYWGTSAAVMLVAPGAVATAVATAVVVLSFRRVRDVVQEQIDRRFAPASARARTLLRGVPPRCTPEDLQSVLADVFDDPSLELELGDRVAGEWIDLGHGAHVRSAAVVPGLLLDTVRSQATAAIEVARLQQEVRTQAAFLAEAHIRIAAAGYEERRRVERDLHDGAQQRLLSLGLQLRRVQRSLPAQAAFVAPALDSAVDEIGHTIAELRRLARGDGPSSLELGLAVALAELADGLPVPLELELPDQRLPERVEAAAYFVACEAVTNAVKHAGASHIRLSAGLVAGALHVTVTDDGKGGAHPVGTGLAGVADRVRAHGGTFSLHSPPGAGTTLQAVLPCG